VINGEDIVNYLKQYIGKPYVWGGNNPETSFDCSGLMQWGFKHFGIDLPRVTYDQIGQGTAIGMKGLRPGDLVFFDTASKEGPDHVGIYMGGGKMLHTPKQGKAVEIADMTQGYYSDRFMGGRRIDTVQSTGANPSDIEESPKMTSEELASNYGWSYGFLNSIPEVKSLFEQAVDGTWTDGKFQAELRDTKWWKETSDTRRQAQVTKNTDPATWSASVQAQILSVRMLAAEIGAAIPESKIKKIAEQSIELGLDEAGMRNTLGQYVAFTDKGTLVGQAGMHEYTMKQYAASQGIQIDKQAIKNQAQLVVRGLATTQDYESQVREQAKSMFPGYADRLDAGMSMREVASPYIQEMSSALGIPDKSIDIMDPMIKSALNGLSQDGKPTGLSLTDFQSQLRNDARWKKTKGAQDQVMTAGLTVLKDMGLR
jgi:hypothetical protein